MRRVALLVALYVGAAVAAAAAGSPRKLLDAATQPVAAQQMQKDAMEQVQERLKKLPIPQSVGAVGAGGSGSSSRSVQPQLPVGATGANPVASTNPDAGEILNAVQSTPGSHKPIDVPPKPDFTGAPLSVDRIPSLLRGLPPAPADTPDALVKGDAYAKAGGAIASAFLEAEVKDGVADAVANGFASADCSGGSNMALAATLGNAAVAGGRAFVDSVNLSLARNFPSSRCSSCYTKTITRANTFARSLGSGNGAAGGYGLGFALAVCMP